MNAIILSKHPLVDGLYCFAINGIEVFFQYVGYDSEDNRLVFERDEEVVTSRLEITSEAELQEWSRMLLDLGVKLEMLVE